jgi:hypothetical protein
VPSETLVIKLAIKAILSIFIAFSFSTRQMSDPGFAGLLTNAVSGSKASGKTES